jgi:carbon monoxide dehydrogenase subunit G
MHCEATRLVSSPPETIWNIIADLSRLNQWLPVQAQITLPGATRAAPGVVVGIKRPSHMGLVELEQIFGLADEPKMLTWRNNKEMLNGKPITQIKDFATTMSLAPDASGQTRVTVRSTWTPVGIMGAAASAMMKPRMQKEYEQALENIERLATTPAAPASPAP